MTQEAKAVLARVLEGANACLTCSFQAEDVVVLHLARQIRPDLPVLFLDTGYHFAATYEYRDRLAADWSLNLINLTARQSVAEQEAQFGLLYQTKPADCCGARKVEPLMRGLEPFEVWLTGLRREQSPTRANLQVEETHKLPTGKQLAKISVLAAWTNRDVWQYAKEHQIPLLSLYDQGYTSIGCEPCTQLPLDPNNARSGRWGGAKLECGIHTFTQPGA